jgi:hypothetical protein
MPNFRDNTTTIQTHLHHLDARSKPTKYQASKNYGHHTQQGDSTMAHHGSITPATKYSSMTLVTRIYSSVFFKHKYLTMPTLTPSNALIQAASNLTDTIAEILPSPNITTDAIDQLINIFELQADKDKDAITAQRVLKEHVQAERGAPRQQNLPQVSEPRPPTIQPLLQH